MAITEVLRSPEIAFGSTPTGLALLTDAADIRSTSMRIASQTDMVLLIRAQQTGVCSRLFQFGHHVLL
mgnify:CR=1 FL=1